MSLWSRGKEPLSSNDVPLPILVHSHPKEAVPPGPLEKGMVAITHEQFVLHAMAGILLPDGTIGDLPEDKIEWARRLTYRHLKREGCLQDYGIPPMAAYEDDVN
jgi:hypothetical protein